MNLFFDNDKCIHRPFSNCSRKEKTYFCIGKSRSNRIKGIGDLNFFSVNVSIIKMFSYCQSKDIVINRTNKHTFREIIETRRRRRKKNVFFFKGYFLSMIDFSRISYSFSFSSLLVNVIMSLKSSFFSR